MNSYGGTGKTRAGMMVLLLGALTACGGGGGGSDNGAGPSTTPPGDTGGEAFDLPALSGLQGDADNQELLYFTQAEGASPGLYALAPENPDAPFLVDGNVELETTFSISYDRSFLPVHEAVLGSDGLISEFRVDRVLYSDNRNPLETEGFHTAVTDDANPSPRPVSSEDLILLNQSFIQDALEDADQTAVLYQAGNEKWLQFHLGDDENTDPLELAENLEPAATIFDPEQAQGAGYLVIDRDDQNRVKRVNMDLELIAGTVTAGGSGVDGEEISGWEMRNVATLTPLGGPLSDGSQYLVVSSTNDPGKGALVLYQPEQNGAGTATYVLDGGESALFFAQALFPPVRPGLPAAQHLSRTGDNLFFALQDDVFGFGDFNLYRVQGTEWSLVSTEAELGDFVIANDGRVVVHSEDQVLSFALDGSDRRVIDSDDSLYGQTISGPVLGARDGWVFYNRASGMGKVDQFAVASRVDGSDQLSVADARWVGASSSGSVPSVVELSVMEVSEVFMVRGDAELAAVSATDPAAGAVSLGSLPGAAQEVRVFGIAPGPHRLMQAVSAGSPETLDVLYVNTREEDSLRVISTQSSGNSYQRPVRGF